MEQEFPEKTVTTDAAGELKRYLLGTVTSEIEREKIEERLLLDKEYFQELLRQEEELIQEFADDELTDKERQDFLRHFLVTNERREKVSFAHAFKIYLDKEEREQKPDSEAAEKTTPKRFWRFPFVSPLPSYALGIGIILTVSSLLLLLGYFFLLPSDSQQALASLNRAYRLQRPLELRITDLNYAPFDNVRSEQSQKVDTTELNLAERIALEDAVRRPSAENLHTLGRIYLSQRKLDLALTELEKALKLAPNNAAALNDLGIVYLEQSKILSAAEERGKSLEFLTKALENFERAIEIKPKLLEARFNKAVGLQTQGLTRQAQTAWQDYLNQDSASPWADEARRNLKLLESNQPTARTADDVLRDFLATYQARDDEKAYQIMSRNREMITGKLIPQRLAFLFLTTKGVEQKEYLAALKYASALEQKKSGDSFFSEIAQFYSTASGKKLSILREAQEAVNKGYELCQQNEFKKAQESFLRAREIFDRMGNVWEQKLTDYWLAYCDARNNDLRASNKRLIELTDFCRAKNYQWLAAQAFYWLSVNARVANEISKSFEYSKEALKFSEATFDLYNTEKTHSWQAEGEARVRQFPKALVNAAEALSLGNLPEASPRQKWRDYDAAAQLFYQLKWYRAAAAFEHEAFELNEGEIKDTSFTRVALARLCRIYASLEKYDQGIDFARRSRAASEALPDEKDRQRSVAFAVLQIAHLELERGDYAAALEHYEKAVEMYDMLAIEQYRYAARKGRLLCHFKSRNDAGIQRELPEVLALFENNRTKILEEQNRNSYFDGEQTVYDLAIEYEYSKGNFEKAFDYSETARARSLLEMQKNGVRLAVENGEPRLMFDGQAIVRPLVLSEIRAQLPSQVRLVQYAVLPDKVLIWLISRDQFETVSSPVSNEDLNEKVTSFIDAIKNKDSVAENASARELYQILFQPLKAQLAGNEELYLIPDKILFHLPFAALVSEQTENFLIADYAIAYAPSTNVFLNTLENERSRNQTEEEEKLLAVGNPAFDRREFPGFEKLPSAAAEARRIAQFYGNDFTLLLDKEATKEKILAEMPEANVVHFAGHYEVSQQSPLLSSFLVAGNGRESRLANYEMFGKRLEKPKLIVLSACQTEVEGFYQGEGMMGAARTFLALGVPLIVASQWEVETGATAELMEKFHRHRRTEKLSSARALRRAQLEMLENPFPAFRHPYYWAGFLALGSDVRF